MACRSQSADYVSQETAAKEARRGVWRGEFVEPSRWRRGERFEAAVANDAGNCRIKGNISRKGTRIYHVAGGAWYAKTRIDTAKFSAHAASSNSSNPPHRVPRPALLAGRARNNTPSAQNGRGFTWVPSGGASRVWRSAPIGAAQR